MLNGDRIALSRDEVERAKRAAVSGETLTLVRRGGKPLPLWLWQLVADSGAEAAMATHRDDVVACCPAGPVGRIWKGVEAYALIWPEAHPPENPQDSRVEYLADGDVARFPGDWPKESRLDPDRPRWMSASAMPGWASRFALELVGARLKTAQGWGVEWELEFKVTRSAER